MHVVEPGIVRTELARSTIVSGGLASGDSPYQPLMGAVLGKIRGIRDEAGLAPAIVAEAIVNIAEDPAAPFRTVLGDTGLLRLANAREGTGDEEFHDAVRGFLGLAEEPSTP